MGIRDAFDPDDYRAAKQRAKELVRADRALIESLVNARKNKGLSQDQVAELMGCDQAAVSRFERFTHDPHMSTVRRYALAVGVEVTHHVGRQRADRPIDESVRDYLTHTASAGAWKQGVERVPRFVSSRMHKHG